MPVIMRKLLLLAALLLFGAGCSNGNNAPAQQCASPTPAAMACAAEVMARAVETRTGFQEPGGTIHPGDGHVTSCTCDQFGIVNFDLVACDTAQTNTVPMAKEKFPADMVNGEPNGNPFIAADDSNPSGSTEKWGRCCADLVVYPVVPGGKFWDPNGFSADLSTTFIDLRNKVKNLCQENPDPDAVWKQLQPTLK